MVWPEPKLFKKGSQQTEPIFFDEFGFHVVGEKTGFLLDILKRYEELCFGKILPKQRRKTYLISVKM